MSIKCLTALSVQDEKTNHIANHVEKVELEGENQVKPLEASTLLIPIRKLYTFTKLSLNWSIKQKYAVLELKLTNNTA